MVLFDVSKYEIPDPKNVDIGKTKYNVGVFLTQYLASRSRVGQPREPKVTATFSLVPPSIANSGHEIEQIIVQNEEAQEEFNYLHDLFVKGYASIQHPFKPEISERRKKIFYDRFISGFTIYITSQRNFVSEDMVSQESSMAIIQFAAALELLIFR